MPSARLNALLGAKAVLFTVHSGRISNGESVLSFRLVLIRLAFTIRELPNTPLEHELHQIAISMNLPRVHRDVEGVSLAGN